jgi:hypothetical protein
MPPYSTTKLKVIKNGLNYLRNETKTLNKKGNEMKKRIILTDRSPKAVTPSVSQGVRVGDWVYMCGQLPLDLRTGDIIGKTVEEAS